MDVQLIPTWAPNVHPMVVHFPIAMAIIAPGIDLTCLLFPRLRTFDRIPGVLYALGGVFAVSAYVTGRLAADAVFIPGMAHALVENHERWALATTGVFVGIAVLRSGVHLTKLAERRAARILFVALGVVVAVMVQQTAERGARLVYEQGVGVIPGPVPAPVDDPDREPPPEGTP